MSDNLTKGTKIDKDNFGIELKTFEEKTDVSYVDNDETRDFLVLYTGTNHSYIVDKDSGEIKENKDYTPPTPVVLSSIKSWTSNANTDFHKESIRKSITEIEFVDLNNITAPAEINETTVWDVSEDGDESIIAWLDETKLYIGGKGGVKANEDSSCIFYNFQNLENIKFNNNYDTSSVTNMNGMFSACYSLLSLDLSSFKTSKVTNMSYMFGPSYTYSSSDDSKKMNLTEIKGLTNFNTSNVTTMESMFWNCGNLTKLDLSSFDTSQVTTMWSMFNMPNDYSSKLEQITLGEKWNTAQVTDMSYLFTQCIKLATIYAYNDFLTDSLINDDYMFFSCSALRGGKGTTVSAINKTYAKIDKNGQAGYFTDIRQNFESYNKELEYIKFNVGNYINTGIIPSNHTTEIKFDFESYENDEHLIGTISGSNRYYFFTSFDNKYYWGLNNAHTSGGSWSTGIHTLTYNGENNSVKLDETTLGSGNLITGTSNLTIGYRDAAGATLNAKVYYVKVTDKSTGKLVRNFIPVYNTIIESYGLYDQENNEFYGNSGTGTFTPGPEKVSE